MNYKIPVYHGQIFYQSKKNIEKALDELERLAPFINFPIFKDLIENEYKLKLPRLLIPGISFVKQPSEGFIRIRKIQDIKQDLNLISTYSFPNPLKFNVGIGRANIPKFPVFYGAFLSQTAAYESCVTIGDKIALSTWKSFPNSIFNIFMFLGVVTSGTSLARKMYEIQMQKLYDKFKICNYKDREILIEIIQRISKWFLSDNSHHLSSCLAHYLLYDTNLQMYNLTTDAIIYNSIQDKIGGMNIAIHPNSLNKLFLERVVIAQVSDINNEGLVFEPHKEGYNSGMGKIKWL